MPSVSPWPPKQDGAKADLHCIRAPKCEASSGKVAESEASKAQRHRDYFFNDGNVVLQVESVLYKLHRSLLEKHSPVFRELFTIPQSPGSTEGCSEDNPIILAGVRATDFTRFLWLLYPPILGDCKITTVDEWLSVVDQADRWEMDSLREFAVNQLRQLYIEPIRKILIWSRYSLPAHELVASYMDVISRPLVLSIGEAQELGHSLIVKISKARDLVHAQGACACCPARSRMGHSAAKDRILADIVNRTFGIHSPAYL
ncbi:hypothetical protein GY45DRAFT_1284362 [Cubamyces sp. BRFM 1775]|nr:hypothetical protein GY45DRAFT_1284362 [Cubamyces sp. BRFM 1775]